jgi:hypothetical protein
MTKRLATPSKAAAVAAKAEPPPRRARTRASRIVDESVDLETMPDTPFAEGSQSEIDPELRHRLISETAYRHYVERGYADGGDLDDWLQAEAEVDHYLVNRPRP